MISESDPRDSNTDVFRQVFQSNPLPMWIYDIDTLRFLDVNDAAVQKYGYTREEFLAMSIKDIRPEEDLDALAELLSNLKENDQFALPDRSWRHRTREGRVIQVHVDSRKIDFGGRRARVVVARDVTEIREAQEALREREERLRFLVSRMPAFFWTTDCDLTVTSCLGAGLAALGIDPEKAVGTNVRDYIALDDSDDPGVAAQFAALAGKSISFGRPFRGRYLQTFVEPFRDSRGAIIGTLGFAFDATEQKDAEAQLRDSEARYRLLFERNLAGVYRSTVDGKLLECNEAFAHMLGYESVEEILATPTLNLYFDDADRQQALARVREAGILKNFELRLKKKNGDPVWVLENEAFIPSDPVHGAVMEGTLIDITDRKRAEEMLQHQAYHDALTDLPNRLLFKDRLNLAIAHARRSGSRLVVMLLDLDHFKLVNETMGDSSGDELLRIVAGRLRQSLRQDDTVARLGGDEFTILLPDTSDEDDAARIAMKVRNTVNEPYHIGGQELYVSTSIGIALYPNDGRDAETLVKSADIAMYRAKESGRDHYQFYTPTAQKRAVERLNLENALRRAADREEFEVHYQPQFNLHTGGIVGAEALIRWRHGDRGLVLPGEFIHVAEEIGLIHSLGEWVLRCAAKNALEWSKKCPSFRLAVNLSARQFQHPGIIGTVHRVLSDTGLHPGLLDLEITESLAMQDIDRTIAVLDDFRRVGIRISMDDFGTGYSSLSYIQSLPIDSLKIDRSFVHALGRQERVTKIVKAVIEMAHSLELRVLAEGVETELQRQTLIGLGCDEMQGFLLSRAIPAADFETLLLNSNLAEC